MLVKSSTSVGAEGTWTIQEVSPTDSRPTSSLEEMDMDEYQKFATLEYPNVFMTMGKAADGAARARKDTPGPEGHWKLTSVGRNTVLLSTERWPDRYLTMEATGNAMWAKSSAGQPGKLGHWLLESNGQGVFRISSVALPGYYLVLDKSGDGSVKGVFNANEPRSYWHLTQA